ncbi:MAG: hypothetical protein GX364_06495 [Firmicutes bacterium]|nr:hypothetical protein [Bacillota bacterium]
MNGDSGKTVTLIILVITSLLLTAFLWYGPSPRHEEADLIVEAPFFLEEPRDEIQAVFPARIALPLSTGQYLVCRRGDDKARELWEQILFYLQGCNFTEEREVLQKEDSLATIYFEPPFPWAAIAATTEQKDLIVEKMQFFVDSGKLYLFLQGPHGELTLKMTEDIFLPGLKDLKTAMAAEGGPRYNLLADARFADREFSDELQIQGEIYFSAEDFFLHEYIVLTREPVKTDAMLKAVFVNDKLARKIEEEDGTLIFTDGEKGLRISDYIEYTAPRLEKGVATLSYTRAIQKANEYLCYYGGWPEYLYLVHMSAARQGESTYCAGWALHVDGMPVLEEPGRTEITFNDRGLYHYKRSLYRTSDFSGRRVVAAPALQAITKAIEYCRNAADMDIAADLKLKDVYPAYRPSGVLDESDIKAYPVWVVRINNLDIYLDLVDLSLSGWSEHDEYL